MVQTKDLLTVHITIAGKDVETIDDRIEPSK